MRRQICCNMCEHEQPIASVMMFTSVLACVCARFQLTTVMSPFFAMARDIPVYRVVQNAGEFVVTFPNAFHAGFSHGVRFARVPVGVRCVPP